ncbi:Hypothetical predicted protein [Paramuricea clavata]|uniref:Uncharacterized protein n=1 Tax=Paramuricea clavata TaxID=317549 RepID=A0A7D9EKD3_PARCT|nr:Hypothetical predicted protein [Paramuricea clavata]
MLIILLLKYKRRKMAPMLSTPVHEAVETAPESLQIDQGPDYENITIIDREFYDDILPTSTEGRTSLYEEVGVQQSVQDPNTHKINGYTELEALRRRTTDDDNYQELLKQEPAYVIPVSVEPEYETPNKYVDENEAYEEPKILPQYPGYTELNKNRLNRTDTMDGAYQKLRKPDSYTKTSK